jgi:hypothetical protein
MKKKLIVFLGAQGNPDFGEPANIGVPSRWQPVKSLCDASRALQAFIGQYDLGAGNLLYGETGTGTVRDGKGKVVARVSYNGRVWGPGKNAPEIVLKCPHKPRAPKSR